MVTVYNPKCKYQHLFTLAFIILFLIPAKNNSQTNTYYNLKLSKPALEFYHSGLDSDNYGVQKSLIYYAGKYRIQGISEHLVDLFKSNMENQELCEMLVWSIYQIGDESCCQDLKKMLKTHPLKKIRDQIKFYNFIKEYENALIAG